MCNVADGIGHKAGDEKWKRWRRLGGAEAIHRCHLTERAREREVEADHYRYSASLGWVKLALVGRPWRESRVAEADHGRAEAPMSFLRPHSPD